MKYITLLFISFFFYANLIAQDTNTELPYYEVPDYEEYTVGTVSARMVDGLGFRYRWATEGLTEEDLAYRPSEGARSSAETIGHILGLSRVIVNSMLQIPNDFTKQQPELTYEQQREETLNNLKKASEILAASIDVSAFKVQFVSSNGTSEYPFWNQLNGPIADALWHTGQVVTFRRSSGNPISSNIQFLQGKIKKD